MAQLFKTIVSLKSLFVVKTWTVLVRISNSQVFCWKNVSGFCSKNISVYAIFNDHIFNDQSFNDILTNDIISFEQLCPEFYILHNK